MDSKMSLIETYRSSRPADRQSCPTPEALSDLAAGQGTTADADHVAGCGACAEEVRLAFALSEELEMASRSQPTRPRWAPWLVAAALFAALAGVLFQAISGVDVLSPQVLRSGGEAVEEGYEPANGEPLAEVPQRLVWPGGASGEHYRVLLFDASATLLWTSDEVAAPSVELPADLRATLGPGEYSWRVVTRRTVEESHGPLHRFVLSP